MTDIPHPLLAHRELFLEGSRQSLLAACFAVSAALHLAALFGVPAHEHAETEVPPQPLSVVLVPPSETAVPAPQRALPPPPRVAPAPPAPVPEPVSEPRPAPPEPARSERVPSAPAVAEALPPPVAVAPPSSVTAADTVAERVVEPEYRAAYLQNTPPRYPASARRSGEQGTVYLRVLVTVEGRAAQVEIERSSGSKVLDRAALESVRGWRFVPARRGTQPVEKWVGVPIVFKLENE